MILFSQQKRRSNRQVKRKKYTEDLDIKITDDEDEMDADVDVTTTPVSSAGHLQSMGAELQHELDGDGLPSMQFFVVRQHSSQSELDLCGYYSLVFLFLVFSCLQLTQCHQ